MACRRRAYLGVDGTLNFNLAVSSYFKYLVRLTEKTIMLCYSSLDFNVQLFRRCEGLLFDDLPVCLTSSPAFMGEHTSPPPLNLLCSGLRADETC